MMTNWTVPRNERNNPQNDRGARGDDEGNVEGLIRRIERYVLHAIDLPPD